MKDKLTLADQIMGAGAIVAFVFSFLPFFELGNRNVNAWDGDIGAFATTAPAILGLVMIIWLGLQLGGVKLPAEVLTFNQAQLKATWAIGAAGISLSWVSADFSDTDKGAGFWLMLLGSFVMAAGAVMGLLRPDDAHAESADATP